MMTAERILHRYETGYTTATGLLLDVLALTDERVVAETLDKLPRDRLREMKEFVGYYTPKVQVFRGPPPRMETVKFVKDWFAKTGDARLRRRRTPADDQSAGMRGIPTRTFPIGKNADFRQLLSHADAVLAAKGYKLLKKRGSCSWIDPRAQSRSTSVRFKLCNCQKGIFFGVRQEWASLRAILVTRLGSEARYFLPSRVTFRGDFVANTKEGRRRINRIVEFFPDAGELKISNGKLLTTLKDSAP